MKNSVMTKTAYSMLCALCIAGSAAVQLVFPNFGANAGAYFAVFLCAVCCPLKYGVLCATVCPAISMMTAGSPAAVLIPAEMAGCLVFLLLSRLLLGSIHTGRLFADLYICLVPAACVGQIVGALISSTIFCGERNAAILYVLEHLIAALPAIAVLLAVTPGAVLLLKSLGMTESTMLSNKKTENSV